MTLGERCLPAMATMVLVLCALLLVCPAKALSEAAEEIAPGTRVRISASQLGAEPVVGTLLGVGPETLSLERAGHEGPEVIARSDVGRLEISRGRKSQAGRGALVGLAAGAAATMLLTFGDYSSDVHGDLNLLAIGAALAAGGAAVGGAIGSAHKTEHWEPVTLPPVSVGIGPVRGGGVGVAVRLSWGSRPATGRLTRRMRELAER